MNRVAPCLLALTTVLYGFAGGAQTRADPEAGGGVTLKPLVTASTHMIVAANPLASEAGARILDAGGSAADAAIAALLVLNVVEPQSSGIGGGAFALVHSGGKLTSWDARETAPGSVTPDLFLEDGAPLPFLTAVASGRSVGVPGLVRLMDVLHLQHGKLPWDQLFTDAIELARDGFEVSPRLAGLVGRYAERLRESDAAGLFLPDGAAIEEGAILRNPALAESLSRIAKDGAAAFYSGDIAKAIETSVGKAPRPGGLTAEDLAGYRVIERTPVCMIYRARHRVCGMGPPSSGATTVGQILALLGRFKPADLSLEEDRVWHLFAEASRLAYADRAQYLADSDHVKVPVDGLLDPGYIAERAQLIDGVKASAGAAKAGEPPWRDGRLYAPGSAQETPGTTHLSVIDGDGLAISLTASIETAFGSGRMAAGFLLNNQLTDFSFRPEAEDGRAIANAPAPGKRPRSSMAPTIVYRTDALDRPVILTGSPGGSRIPEYVAASLVAMLDFDLDPAEAAALPHVSHRNRGAIALEPGFPERLADGLAARGHVIEWKDMTSGLHIVEVAPDGVLFGGADPRREGRAVGR